MLTTASIAPGDTDHASEFFHIISTINCVNTCKFLPNDRFMFVIRRKVTDFKMFHNSCITCEAYTDQITFIKCIWVCTDEYTKHAWRTIDKQHKQNSNQCSMTNYANIMVMMRCFKHCVKKTLNICIQGRSTCHLRELDLLLLLPIPFKTDFFFCICRRCPYWLSW